MTKPALAVETPEGRRYLDPTTGEMVPSVTTILKAIPKDLADWAAKQAAQWVVDNREDLDSFPDAVLFNLIATAHERTRDEASAKGDTVHNSAEAKVKGEDDGNSPKHMKQLDDFLRVSGFTPIRTELTLWNENEGYAGTADLLAKDRNGRMVLIDYKTGRSVWNEAAIQLEALARCDYILNVHGVREEFNYIHTVGVLHLRPQSWWWHPIQDVEVRQSNYEVFLACLSVYEAMEPIRAWKSYHPNMIWGNLGRFNEANWPQRKAA